MLQIQPQSKWAELKRFFLYSETILLARITAVAGLVTGAVGAMEWSPLLGLTNFDRKQVIWLGSIMFLQGVGTEIARRRNMMAAP